MDSHQQKVSHLKSLYYLACADDKLSSAEAIYIRTVAERLGISMTELSNYSGTELPDLVLPDREYKLFSLFHRLTIVIMVDNDINPIERQFCFNLGIQMGLHPNAVGEILDHVIDKGAMNALPSEIIAIFKKYMS